MEIFICKDYDHASKLAANILASHILLKPDSILGLATGSTPVGMYKYLVEKFNAGELSFKEVKSFNLDEYVKLPKDDVNSYYTFMYENLFNHIDIDKENVNIPDGNVVDPIKFCDDYDKKIDECGGIDVQILGIGQNAHIGFNEPDSVFYEKTRVVDLAESTIKANSRFFNTLEEVPTQAISMGIGTIMKSKHIILMANGESKAEAIKNMIVGDIDPKVPASILKLHPRVTVIVDEEAGALVKDYI